MVLGAAMLEPVLALGGQPAAYADYQSSPLDKYDDPSQQIPYLGDRIVGPIDNIGSVAQPNIEAIAKVKPDLILGTEYNAAQYNTFSQIAPTLLLTWTEAEGNLRAIAQIFGKSAQAEQLIAERAQQVADAHKAFAAVAADYPKALVLHANTLQKIYFRGDQMFGLCASLVKELGFDLVSLPGFDEFNSDTPAVISVETLPQLSQDADLILMFGSDFDLPEQLRGTDDYEEHQISALKEAWEENEIAQSLETNQAGRVYFMPYALCASLPGPIGTELYLEELKEQLLSP
ncbi:MAG: ABC transporter substrate-binding protein [Cyanobacteria bacterium P01_H01_bin.119]